MIFTYPKNTAGFEFGSMSQMCSIKATHCEAGLESESSLPSMGPDVAFLEESAGYFERLSPRRLLTCVACRAVAQGFERTCHFLSVNDFKFRCGRKAGVHAAFEIQFRAEHYLIFESRQNVRFYDSLKASDVLVSASNPVAKIVLRSSSTSLWK